MDAAYRQKLKNIKKHKIKQWKARKKARVAEERQKERRDRFIESLRQTGDLKVAKPQEKRSEQPMRNLNMTVCLLQLQLSTDPSSKNTRIV